MGMTERFFVFLSLVTLTFDLWPWHSRSSERGTKHVFAVNLAQIHSEVPEIFEWQTKWKTKSQTALKTEAYLRAVIIIIIITMMIIITHVTIRLHRNTTEVDTAYCYRPSSVVCWSVCQSVCHSSEPCKNGWTDWNAVWVEDSGGPRNHVLDRIQIPHEKGQS